MTTLITPPPPPHLLKKFSTEARDESNKRNGAGYLKTFARLCIEWANSKSTPNSSQIRSSDITPPPELVQQWMAEIWHEGTPIQVSLSDEHIATRAAQWGADQELEACKQWLSLRGHAELAIKLAYYMRNKPEPPSLKERALAALDDDDD